MLLTSQNICIIFKREGRNLTSALSTFLLKAWEDYKMTVGEIRVFYFSMRNVKSLLENNEDYGKS